MSGAVFAPPSLLLLLRVRARFLLLVGFSWINSLGALGFGSAGPAASAGALGSLGLGALLALPGARVGIFNAFMPMGSRWSSSALACARTT